MRKSAIYLFSILSLTILFSGFVAINGFIQKKDYETRIKKCRKVTGELGLTDICLFTEARYTRHLTQADLFSAFQDGPMSFEHFPSGSLVLPPGHLAKER